MAGPRPPRPPAASTPLRLARRPAPPARRITPRPRWTVMAVILLGFLSILSVNGFVHGTFGVDARVAPPVSASEVPKDIRAGGPIIDATHGEPTSYRVPDGMVLLTFDDGPDPTWTPAILEVLRKYRVPATFFVVGSLAARHPDVMAEIRASGSDIGLHTFTHPDLAYTPQWRQERELSETQLAVAGAANVTTSLVRPPYSSTTEAIDNEKWPVLEEIGQQGYVTVLTTADTEDWRRPGVDAIVRNGTPAGKGGESILLHDGGGERSQTVKALDRLIPKLQRMGYEFGTVGMAMHGRAANRDAGDVERLRGLGLVTVVQVAGGIVWLIAGFLLVVGVLVLVRLLLMLLLARRHVRRTRSAQRRQASRSPPVTGPVSVVVPAYNEEKCIADTVRSLVASDHPVEVIVVDDGSTDDTAGVAERLALPNVRVVRKPNGGKPSALNTGIMLARYDLVVMIDGDTVFAPDTVSKLVSAFEDPRVGAVAGNAKVANRRRMIGLWQHIEYVIGFNIDRRVYDVLHCMPTVPGAVGAFRREALLQVGGVSDDTLAEDTDLTMAVCRAGWHVVYVDSARAWTEAPATLGQLWRQRYRWSYGTIQSMWKHRRSVIERGASGRFGRWGLLHLSLFQVVLPTFAPLVDVFLVYGLIFLDPWRTLLLWCGVLVAQAIGGLYAFWLDKERPWPLLLLPLQQFVYRQIMYAVVIQSVVTAVGGIRLRWHKLDRTGGLAGLAAGGSPVGSPRQ